MARKKYSFSKDAGESVSPSVEKSEKKSRREKIRIAELELKILRRDRDKARAMLVSVLQIANDLIKRENEPLIIGKALIKKGHKDSTIQDLFKELSDYTPQLLKPHNGFEDGKIGRLTGSFIDVIEHDIKFWNELKELKSANESEITDIEKLGKLLEEFKRLSKRVVRI